MNYEKTMSKPKDRLSSREKIALGSLALIGGLFLFHHAKEPTMSDLAKKPHIAYTIKPGDTAWDIVNKANPNLSEGVMLTEVDMVQKENALVQATGAPLTEQEYTDLSKDAAKDPEVPLVIGTEVYLPKQ